MAWSFPRSWFPLDKPSGSDLNTDWRDNFNEMAPAKVSANGQSIFATGPNAIVAVKNGAMTLGDSAIYNSAVQQNIADMSFPINNGEIWVARYFIKMDSDRANADWYTKFGWSYPTASTIIAHVLHPRENVSAQYTGEDVFDVSTVGSGVGAVQVDSTWSGGGAELVLYIAATANGTVQLRFAQSPAALFNYTVKQGTTMELTRLK